MAITVTLPVATPTNLSSVLVEGGSLDASTQYYYVVIAFDTQYISPVSFTRFCYHSPISAEGTFTTDITNKSVTIKWDDSAGATRYQVLLTKVSGDYTDSGGYNVDGTEDIGDITTGVTGVTITAESTSTVLFHSTQLVNALVGSIDRDLGTIKVDFADGGTGWDLQDIYDAIDGAGLGAYVNWDGTRLILKGWIVSSGTDSGSFTVTKKSLVFIRGGIHCGNPNFTMRFGVWTSDAIGANVAEGCHIDIQHSRYPIRSAYSGLLQIYGSLVSFGYTRITTLSENLSNVYYTGNGQVYFSNYVDEMKDSILGVRGRSVTGDIIDLKWGQGNNWGNGNHIRLNIYNSVNMPYYAGGKFYACTFNTYSSRLRSYIFPGSGYSHYTDFYDCLFPNYPGGMITEDYWRWGGLTVDILTSPFYYDFNYTLKLKIIDIDSNPIVGATVSMTDKDNNLVTWIEGDGTYNNLVTGTTYATDRTTDANGEIEYYVKSYKLTLDPENTEYPNSDNYTIKTNSYPFTLTVSKSGYSSVMIKGIEFAEKKDWIVKLSTEDYGKTTIYDSTLYDSVIY